MLIPPAVVDTQKPQSRAHAVAVVSDSPSLTERVLIFRICGLLGIPLRQIGVVKERNNMPVLIINAEMTEALQKKLDLGFSGVFPELGIIDSKGGKFIFRNED